MIVAEIEEVRWQIISFGSRWRRFKGKLGIHKPQPGDIFKCRGRYYRVVWISGRRMMTDPYGEWEL
jgi:hypothetical protein